MLAAGSATRFGSDKLRHTLPHGVSIAVQSARHLKAEVERVVAVCGGKAGTDLMMTSEQLRAAHVAGMTIGGHTVSHPILTRLDSAVAYGEIATGKERLEHVIGKSVDVFAYPNGKPGQDYAAEHVGMLRRCGFRCAGSTAWGAAKSGADLLQLPRFTPWSRERTHFGLQLLRNLSKTRIDVV